LSTRSVAVTGASSFTGLWICAAFRTAGWRVLPLLTRASASYTGLRARRVARLDAPVVAGTAESGALAAWARQARPDIWVHHHHWMEAFRSPDYDVPRADAVGVAPLDHLIAALADAGCRGIVHSGTFFEPGEGGSTMRATAYGDSKARVWTALCTAAARDGVPLAKVVIPNPIGPLENEDRLIPTVIARARAGAPIELRAPDAVSDHLPADALARCYVALAERLLAGETGVVVRPSGRVARLADWFDELNRELIGKRLGLPPVAAKLAPLLEDATSLRNSEIVTVDWTAFWDWYASLA
jgi:UDP-glucose 4-epimerase